MAEYKDYISNVEEDGSINISEDVIAAIASIAVGEVEGIAGLSGPSGKDLAEVIGVKKGQSKGIKVQIENGVINIDIYVKVKYGVKIPEMAANLQQLIESSVNSMTELGVGSVNVYVVGIEFAPVQAQTPPQA